MTVKNLRGVALVGGAAMQERGMSLQAEPETDGPVQVIEPEYFVFADNSEYLRGFASAANTIAKDLGAERGAVAEEEELEAAVLGATWDIRTLRDGWSRRKRSSASRFKTCMVTGRIVSEQPAVPWLPQAPRRVMVSRTVRGSSRARC